MVEVADRVVAQAVEAHIRGRAPLGLVVAVERAHARGAKAVELERIVAAWPRGRRDG